MVAEKELRSLTALRGVASLVVLLFHTATLIIGDEHVARVGLGRGYLAVDLFFMLSGFVLAHVYGDTIGRPGAVRAFLWARFARIYPTHLAVLLLLLPFYGSRSDCSGTGLAISLALQIPWHGTLCWNYAAWSISCEVYAYALFPLVARRMLAGGPGSWVTAAACAEVIAVMIWHQGTGENTVGLAALWRALPEFLIGIALYRAYAQGCVRKELQRDRVALAACAAIAAFSFLPTLPCDIAIIAALALLLMAVAHNRGRVAQLLETAPAQYLGKISYSLYLVQAVPQLLLDEHITAFPHALQTAPMISAIFIGSCLLGAVLLSASIEYPARRCLRALMSAPPTKVATALQEG